MAASKAQLEHLKRLNFKRKQNSINNFHRFVIFPIKCGCMIFIGKISTNSYGSYQITLGDNTEIKGAHRVAYYLANGEINQSLNVNHNCDNHLCCNPEHLWQGTQKENLQDMVRKGRHNGMKGRKHTEESKAKISSWNKENGNAFAGKNHTTETREKMRKAWVLRKERGE